MTEVTWPSTLIARSFSLRLKTDQRVQSAPFGGSERVVDLEDDYWLCTVGVEFATRAQAGELDVLITQLSKGTTYTRIGHLARPTNRGTLTTSTGTLFPALKGADFITINAATGTTLRTGDMLECSGLLLQVNADAVSVSNTMNVFLSNRLRKAIPASTAVNLTTPKAKFKLMGNVGLSYDMNFAEPFTLDFEELV